MIHRHRSLTENRGTGTYSRFFDDLDAQWPAGSDLAEVFSALTRELQNLYEFDHAVLLVRENGNTRFTAVSTWDSGRIRRNLTLVVPGESSLFDKIAESGRIYSEEYCGLFSGNPFERELLINDSTQSYALQPLKHDGEVVGLIGFSSAEPSAFATFEEGALSRIADQLARRVAAKAGVTGR